MQAFAGLPETGVMDAATAVLMNTTRCGMPDVGRSDSARRKRRYSTQGSKWNKQVRQSFYSIPVKLVISWKDLYLSVWCIFMSKCWDTNKKTKLYFHFHISINTMIVFSIRHFPSKIGLDTQDLSFPYGFFYDIMTYSMTHGLAVWNYNYFPVTLWLISVIHPCGFYLWYYDSFFFLGVNVENQKLWKRQPQQTPCASHVCQLTQKVVWRHKFIIQGNNHRGTRHMV